MKIQRDWAKTGDEPTALAIGNFDSVHRGHEALLRRMLAAKPPELTAGVITFQPHPLAVLRPQDAPPRLSDFRSRVERFSRLGIERVNLMHFTKSFAQMSAEDFVAALRSKLDMKLLAVGNDFRFGQGRAGNVAMLRELAPAQGFELLVLEDELADGLRVSSKLIRQTVTAADFKLAGQLLGRPYCIAGVVQHGAKLGSELGVPTANIRFPDRPPLHGIYAAFALLDGRRHPAAVSAGWRPSIEDRRFAIEAHLIGFHGDLYGKRLELQPTMKLRDEKKYADMDQLREAMQADIRRCEQVLKAEAAVS